MNYKQEMGETLSLVYSTRSSNDSVRPGDLHLPDTSVYNILNSMLVVDGKKGGADRE